jgi:catechol 2,3-dioxygenase-like lactoylglutathione lyase family enzyme
MNSQGSDKPVIGRITGLGGIFFKARDPAALAAWYRDVLGVGMEGWNGALFAPDEPGRPPFQLWSPFQDDTDYFAPSDRPFMINFAVDDLDAFLARLTHKPVQILKREDNDPNGKFAWLLDPEGTKIELWQPNPG